MHINRELTHSETRVVKQRGQVGQSSIRQPGKYFLTSKFSLANATAKDLIFTPEVIILPPLPAEVNFPSLSHFLTSADPELKFALRTDSL